jgi:hypothetical protein
MSKRPRRQRQQLIFQEQEQKPKQEQPQQQEQEQKQEKKQQQEFTIILREGACIKEHKLLKCKSNPYSVYKIQHNIWYNRARRRWKKSEYFSERA